jgi:hypothetical protein
LVGSFGQALVAIEPVKPSTMIDLHKEDRHDQKIPVALKVECLHQRVTGLVVVQSPGIAQVCPVPVLVNNRRCREKGFNDALQVVQQIWYDDPGRQQRIVIDIIG